MTPDNVSYFDTATGANLTIVQRNSTGYKGKIVAESRSEHRERYRLLRRDHVRLQG